MKEAEIFVDEKLITQVRLLKKYISILENISKKSEKEYLEDEILRGAAERYLQLAIETSLNIGSRIISLEQFTNNLKAPETYAEIFEVLFKLNILDKRFSENLSNMAKFRNRLVHMYWEIDSSLVYNIIVNNLEDIKKFLRISAEYLNRL